jgi:diguanylate cyclase (GGDEF)-like protein
VVLPRMQLVEAQAVGHAIERAAEVMQQVKFLAQHDALTRLPNRVLFEDFAARRMALAHRQGCHVVMMAVDLDGFKRVNDTQGHAKGDEVLQIAAQRLSAAVRASDMVARIGGDEFLVLLYDIELDAALDTAHRMVMSLSEPYQGVEAPVSASVGVAAYRGEPETLAALCGRADQALYQAKQSGKNRAVLASP